MNIAVESSKISSAVLLAALNCKASIFPMYTRHDAAKQIKLTRRKKSSPPQNRSLMILLSLAILDDDSVLNLSDEGGNEKEC